MKKIYGACSVNAGAPSFVMSVLHIGYGSSGILHDNKAYKIIRP